MSQYDDHTQQDKPMTEQVKEKVAPYVEQSQATVSQIREKATDEKVTDFCKTNSLQLITTVAVVGILLTNRKQLKFAKSVIKNNNEAIAKMADVIKECKDAGKTFEYFPGLGIWVNN